MATIQAGNCRFENIQAIVFDKDGTLARSEVFLCDLAQRRADLINAQVPGVRAGLLQAFGVEAGLINPAGLMAVGTRLENELSAAAYIAATGKGWVEASDLAHTLFQSADPAHRKADQTPLIPDSLELMQQMSQAHVKLAILSSDSQVEVESFVSQFELKPYFQTVLGVNAQYSHKSDPALLQILFNQLNVPSSQTLMVGDSQLDVLVARRAEMAGCIGFSGGWTMPSPPIAADITVDSFRKIKLL